MSRTAAKVLGVRQLKQDLSLRLRIEDIFRSDLDRITRYRLTVAQSEITRGAGESEAVSRAYEITQNDIRYTIKRHVEESYKLGIYAVQSVFGPELKERLPDRYAGLRDFSIYTQAVQDRIRAAVESSIILLEPSPKTALDESDAALAVSLGILLFDQQKNAHIASSEVTKGYSYGSMMAATRSLPNAGKVWQSLSDVRVCPVCRSNDGTRIGIEDTFPSGVECPPAHPYCRCGMYYVYTP